MASSHGELRIDDALSTIKAGGVKNRTDGIAALLTVFKNPRQQHLVTSLKDAAYLGLFTTLFRAATEERRVYLSSKTATGVSKAERALLSCSEALRVAIRAGHSTIKPKTLKILLQLTIDFLRIDDGSLDLPWAQQYLKVLGTALEHEAHVELLDGDDWEATVAFCIEGIFHQDAESSRISLSRQNSLMPGLSSTPRGRPSPASRATSEASQLAGIKKRNAEELMECLRSLVSASNAPVLKKPAGIIDAIVHFLQCQGPIIGHFHQVAFSALNTMLLASSADEVGLTTAIIPKVLPLIGQLWGSKTAANDEMLNVSKDEMAITILLLRLHTKHLMADANTPQMEGILREAQTSLRNDYDKRGRDQLQLDDLYMTLDRDGDSWSELLPGGYLHLQPHGIRTERRWVTLQALAALEGLLYEEPARAATQHDDDEHNEARHPRKRRRVARRFDALVDDIRLDVNGGRLSALQILMFALPHSSLDEDNIEHLFTQLMPYVLDRSSEISCWAMLCCAGLAQKVENKIPSETAPWKNLWSTVSRAVTSPALCRPACHLLHIILANGLVDIKDVAEGATAMLTVPEINAPSILSDASLGLMRHLFHAKKAEGSGGAANNSPSIVRWLFSNWHPAEKALAARNFGTVHPIDILNMLRAVLDLPAMKTSARIHAPGGHIRQAWLRHVDMEDTLRFILLLGDAPTKTSQCARCTPKASIYSGKQSAESPSHGHATKRLVLDLLAPKIEAIRSEWEGQNSYNGAQMSTDVIKSSVSACVTACLVSALVEDAVTPSPRATDIGAALEAIATAISTTTSDSTESKSRIEAMLYAVQQYLPSANSGEIQHLYRSAKLLAALFNTLSNGTRTSSLQESNSFHQEDPMDIDDGFDSQLSHQLNKRTAAFERKELALKLSSTTFIQSTTARLQYTSSFEDEADDTLSVPQSFVDYISELSPTNLLASQATIIEVLHSDQTLDANSAEKILTASAALLSAQLSMCEVTLSLCIDILEGLVPHWVDQSDTEIADMAEQLYVWFIETVATQRRPSPRTQHHLSELLYAVLHQSPLHGEVLPGAKPAATPSARTAIFDILPLTPMVTKFSIARALPEIFSLFVLNNHLPILQDLLKKLPIDPENMEEIAFRLFVLSRLAARWPTLLRTCAYYMLEVSGEVESATPHATLCIRDVSAALKLKNGKELFQLFSSQFLFTWFTTHSFDSLAWRTFGYLNLNELLSDSREEITALMIMRNRDEEVEVLAEELGIPMKDLVKEAFTKVISYSVAHDIAVPPTSSAGEKYITGEARVRKLLKDDFYALISVHFTDIIAMFLKSMDHEHDLERHFLKDTALNLGVAAEALKIMKSTCHPDDAKSLTPNQQPNFKAKCLVKEIVHICSRTQCELQGLWTEAMVVCIARSLLDGMSDAIGSLHNCSVLRKLRVLVALSGQTALQGYCIEMLLMSLRPLFMDHHCADDAIGIAQYLFEKGISYLQTVPSFIAGIALAILGSIRVLRCEKPSSTTQQSQFIETMNKIERFHAWFCSYLRKYDSSILKPNKDAHLIFNVIIDQAIKLTPAGGPADVGTTDGELLLSILRDKRGNCGILSRPSREMALSLVYKDFQAPTSFRTDNFGGDERSAKYASTLWDICKHESANEKISTWAATIFGRAFAASGYIEPSLLQETGLNDIKNIIELDPRIKVTSHIAILNLVKTLTVVDYQGTSGHAERALRRIVTSISASGDEKADEWPACVAALPQKLLDASQWDSYEPPPSDMLASGAPVPQDPFGQAALTRHDWLESLSVHLAQSVPDDPILYPLQQLLLHAPGFAQKCFPFILHIVLLQQKEEENETTKRHFSAALRYWLGDEDSAIFERQKLLLNAILYLRTQPIPREKSVADRTQWLDLDFKQAAAAAIRCKMYKTALLLTEISASSSSDTSSFKSITRKCSGIAPLDDHSILFDIYKNVDDPDIFYGLQQRSDLKTLSTRLEFERNGMKTLMFKGAEYDTHLRRGLPSSTSEQHSLINALGMLSLDGLSHNMLQTQQVSVMDEEVMSSMYQTARKLEQWDLPIPDAAVGAGDDNITIYRTFQSLSNVIDRAGAKTAVNEGLSATMGKLLSVRSGARPVHGSLQALAVLMEIGEVVSTNKSEEFEEMLGRFEGRSKWMGTGRYEDVSQIISCRETMLSSLSQQPRLREIIDVSSSDTRLVETRVALLSSAVNRKHGALQESLTTATYANSLIEPCRALALEIEAAAGLEVASAMWDQGEIPSSIGVLQELQRMPNLKSQTIPVSKAIILAKLASQISHAKLEKSDRIIDKYLKPALKELKDNAKGSDAGQVYREFAVFCDRQYQDQDAIDDIERLRFMKESKEEEVATLAMLIKEATSKSVKNTHAKAWEQANKWLRIDREEFERLLGEREALLKQSLCNYLLSLAAWDGHNSDAVRFTALWLEHAEQVLPEELGRLMKEVPTYKFAALANQLTSRLLDEPDDEFQRMLFDLVLGICSDHPYHGMYQVWAGQNTNPKKEDEVAVSRQRATANIGKELKAKPQSKDIWVSVSASNEVYCRFAAEKERYKQGMRIKVSSSPGAISLERSFRNYKLPPPTLQVELDPQRDYSRLPTMHKLEPTFSIASGISAPKIITVIASNGRRYKQLVKGGSDDLRQDAIMEQVFTSVSSLLRVHSSTRQRNLGIRTYKVQPLSSTAGIIEFVPNTLPLHDYLIPAHTKYHPKDLGSMQARKEISDAQQSDKEKRVRVFRRICERFRPVMRYFHLERFPDPDEWFEKRQAYTRSTAAISMLGYVLGLGDRHGHNILLDEVTGEVVHIDLGVAFEMGRVLPVPELVPFRLTRDIVDGMGLSGTEGTFRRCCEFVLEALRKEKDTIMTVLDVLRYDPLYTWSISPVRLAKLQEAQSAVPISTAGSTTSGVTTSTRGEREKEVFNEPSEADRALTVVSKKLSKGLSVTAMVADLINQATDERNLAVLYSGWAAYA